MLIHLQVCFSRTAPATYLCTCWLIDLKQRTTVFKFFRTHQAAISTAATGGISFRSGPVESLFPFVWFCFKHLDLGRAGSGRQYSGGINSPFPLSQWSGQQLGLCLSSAAAAPEQILAVVLSAAATKGRRRRRRRRGREEAEFFRATWLMTIPADGGRHWAGGCLPPRHGASFNITTQIYRQRAWLTNTHSGIWIPLEQFEEKQADGWTRSSRGFSISTRNLCQ